jgi:hypothetical protein
MVIIQKVNTYCSIVDPDPIGSEPFKQDPDKKFRIQAAPDRNKFDSFSTNAKFKI